MIQLLPIDRIRILGTNYMYLVTPINYILAQPKLGVRERNERVN